MYTDNHTVPGSAAGANFASTLGGVEASPMQLSKCSRLIPMTTVQLDSCLINKYRNLKVVILLDLLQFLSILTRSAYLQGNKWKKALTQFQQSLKTFYLADDKLKVHLLFIECNLKLKIVEEVDCSIRVGQSWIFDQILWREIEKIGLLKKELSFVWWGIKSKYFNRTSGDSRPALQVGQVGHSMNTAGFLHFEGLRLWYTLQIILWALCF